MLTKAESVLLLFFKENSPNGLLPSCRATCERLKKSNPYYYLYRERLHLKGYILKRDNYYFLNPNAFKPTETIHN